MLGPPAPRHITPKRFLVARVVALVVTLFICFAVAARVVGIAAGSGASGQGAALALLTVCLLDTLVLTHIILRSRWAGWPLVAAVFVVFYGSTTFMSQIESAVFLTRLPPGTLPRLFLMGVITVAPFSVLAVLLLGKWKADATAPTPNERLDMPVGEWAWRLALIALVYVALYFTFGYYVAWQNPAVREYYGGIDEGSFLAHMGSVARHTAWLFPFQALRAILWALIALPLIRMMKGRWPETALAVGLAFAVLMNTKLLLPNPFMPEVVRRTHLIETASSNFIFGLFVGWLLTRPRRPASAVTAPRRHPG
jgi:hypothetical protein